MANRLTGENSPYLLQHADNPVNWYPWSQEALDSAKREDKPIFLSIGYSACHWCHVMAHESFEDPQIAEFMNQNFISIKVDREERPDIDSIYMNAVVGMTGHGGWPMSVFLTPQGQPFYGGTYYPPTRRFNMPSFREILDTVDRLWKSDRKELLKSAKEVSAYISKNQQVELRKEIDLDSQVLDQSSLRLAQSYDWRYGGWGAAPKFPQPMAIEFLLQRAIKGDRLALDMAEHALDAMSRGGMYDVLGGGFARYSTDNDWLVPHFEKMLYDNALLSRVYLHAYLISKESRYLDVCRMTLDFIQRELKSPEGGFFSSLDADSEGEEGKFYSWDYDEIASIIHSVQSELFKRFKNPEELFALAFGLLKRGNFEGRIILQRVISDEELAANFHISVDDVSQIISIIKKELIERRECRTKPGTDDKILTSWNALTLVSFSEAARYLGDQEYLKIAQANAAFLTTEMFVSGNLHRSWRRGKAQHIAYLEDYASLVLGLLVLYQTDHDNRWFQTAKELTNLFDMQFTDEMGGYFDSSDNMLLTRPKDVQDNATPCGNSLAAIALLQMSAFTGIGEWRQKAEQMVASVQEAASRYPTAFANWLSAILFALSDPKQIALISPADKNEFHPFLEIIWERYRPELILAASKIPIPDEAPELLVDRPILDEKTTAYLCEGFICKQPVTSPVDLAKQLDQLA